MGQIADVPKPDIHRPLHDDGRVVRPVRHAMPDGYGHIDPWRFAGFGHGGPPNPASSPAIFGSLPVPSGHVHAYQRTGPRRYRHPPSQRLVSPVADELPGPAAGPGWQLTL